MVHTPMEGLRVEDLGTHVAVPSSARLLAEYGADVIKVESLIGDDWRRSGLNVGLCIDDFSNTVFTIQNNAEGFATLLQTIRCCARPEDKIKVGLEATGHYSYNIL